MGARARTSNTGHVPKVYAPPPPPHRPQVVFAATLFYLASISTIFSALCVHEEEKIPNFLRAVVRIAPIAFSEPVAFAWR